VDFTDKYIANLKPNSKQYVEREKRGFAVRVLPSGQKTFLFIYTFDGMRRQLNLGSYPEKSLANARADHASAYAMLHNPNDPRDPLAVRSLKQGTERLVREEQRKHPTVARLIHEYLENFAKEKKKTWAEDQRILGKDVLPIWAERKAREITRRDVLLLIEGMKGRGPAITLNTFKIIRRVFKYAVKQEIIGQSPCVGFEKGDELPMVPSRERNLDEDEIRVLWEGLKKASVSDETRRALKVILVTCQRPGEVVTMHRSQIKGRWWEFMSKSTKVTRENPRPQRIYLTDLALELIGDSDGYIFPSPRTERGMTERALASAIRKNLKGYTRRKPSSDPNASNIPKMVRVKEERKIDMAHFTPHDLRRTGATMISSLGFSDEIVDAILAHLKKGIIKVYNRHGYDLEKQTALEAWERKLRSIITGIPEGKVLPLRRQSASYEE